MTPSTPDALAALRDIHLPDPVSFWPLAPGWWVVITSSFLLGVGLWLVHRARGNRAEAWNVAAARELDHLEAAYREKGDRLELAAGLSALLRRTALIAFPEDSIAALHGDEWFDFLCRSQGETGTASPEPNLDPPPTRSPRVARELVETAYRGDLDGDEDPELWLAFTRRWLEEIA